jgi:hypothetical protein
LKIFIHYSRGKIACFDFGWIIDVTVPKVMKHVSDWKTKRVFPELQHVSEFVKDELDCVSV